MVAASDDGGTGTPAFTQSREFWATVVYAAVLGIFGAGLALVFLGLVGQGSKWFQPVNSGWFGGRWWWIAVTAAAGLLVAILHRATRLPDKTPGVIQDLQSGEADPALVPGIVLTSFASLIGGASLGPEKALGSAVGGTASWLSRRRGMNDDEVQANTVSGFAGAYGGLLSSPVIVVMLILELFRPGGEKATRTLINTVVASSVSFGVYFAIAGSVFLDIYKVPQYAFKSWHLLAGVALGVATAVLVMGMVLVIAVCMRAFTRATVPRLLKPVIGGALFGLVGVILPLTMFTGSSQLTTVINDAPTLGTWLLVSLVAAKTFTFAVSAGSGFVGGPIFPALFIGGTAGVAVHMIVPGVPLALSFTCMLAAVPGALVSAPFTMVLLAALVTQVGGLQTAPVLLAVVTANLTLAGSQFLVKLASRARKNAPTTA